jgi:hypothetical protein
MSLHDDVQRMLRTLTPADLAVLRKRFPDLKLETPEPELEPSEPETEGPTEG